MEALSRRWSFGIMGSPPNQNGNGAFPAAVLVFCFVGDFQSQIELKNLRSNPVTNSQAGEGGEAFPIEE
jgi:hypothetical protein